MSAPTLLRADARALPLSDESVDLVVTSPPYFGLRDYGTDGQLGAEPTPREFIDALIACTAEMVRVLKPSGSIFLNLGDKYSTGNSGQSGMAKLGEQYRGGGHSDVVAKQRSRRVAGMPPKSLLMLPERYRIAAVDELGLIARAVIVWDKPNGLPESVTDRVRRSHEDWVHLVKSPRYYSAVDEIREQYTAESKTRGGYTGKVVSSLDNRYNDHNPLGKLPGSVWTVATQPLNVPDHLNVDHYAAFPMHWPRQLITGWCPREVCTACGEGRRPTTSVEREHGWTRATIGSGGQRNPGESVGQAVTNRATHTITGYACACTPTHVEIAPAGNEVTVYDWHLWTPPPATPGVCLDPFGGTGTTALVAHMLGRRGISVDLSTDYQRIARWRCSDPRERARAAGLDPDQVSRIPAARADQDALFEMDAS